MTGIRKLLAIAERARLLVLLTLVITVAQAQDDTGEAPFLPIPEGIPVTIVDGFGSPEDPTEIAQEIRSSLANLSSNSALTSPSFEARIIGITSAPAVAGATAEPDANSAHSASLSPKTATISVVVENIETNHGTVNIGLCDKGLSRDACPYDKEVRASAGFVETTFENILPGNYAIVAYHDENENGQFDRLLGLPREPYALSGRAAKKMVPSFNDAALPIVEGYSAVVIRLKRLGRD